MADKIKAALGEDSSSRRNPNDSDEAPPPPYLGNWPAGRAGGRTYVPSTTAGIPYDTLAAMASEDKQRGPNDLPEEKPREIGAEQFFSSDYDVPPPADHLPWNTDVTSAGRVDVLVHPGDLELDAASRPPMSPHSPAEPDVDIENFASCPPLNIVMFIVGSRGDLQPYLALALQLITTAGHRVRIATHAEFAPLIADASVHLAGLTSPANGTPLTGNLEHFDIGGDPHELMAYMVKNPGLIPGLKSVWEGDIKRKRAMVKTILMRSYLACHVANEVTRRPFGADAIIANPPAFAHIHVAEALGLPLLISFTMPWTPTTAFPHPLVRAKGSEGGACSTANEGVSNYSSYVLADTLMWQGLGDIINSFRYGILGLQPLQLTAGPRVLERLQVPVTYAWSEALLPKPVDWKGNIDVVGFYTMPTKSYGVAKVDPTVYEFLRDGPPPVYIGFGSIVIPDPDAMTRTILDALKEAGVRAIISAGWANLGSEPDLKVPQNVLIVKGDIPHDWLFANDRVAAVVHHGGAGTTAAGLAHGLPTVIVPFFGDQWFWGKAVSQAGAGPGPIPYAELTPSNLSAAIAFALTPSVREHAQSLGARIRAEHATAAGVQSLHKHLPLLNMRCSIHPHRTATFWSDRYQLRLGGAAAAVLVEDKVASWSDFTPHRPAAYEATRHYVDPIRAVGQSFVNVGGQAMTGMGQMLYAPTRGVGSLLFGVPKASFQAVVAMQEGLENMPGIMGSTPQRRRGKVDGFRSGVEEGVKGFGHSVVDGVTGLVTEPYAGFKEGGVGGLISGTMRGAVNLATRPAAGALGLAVHPTVGLMRGARSKLAKEGMVPRVSVLCEGRESDAHAAAARLTPEERSATIAAWRALTEDDVAVKTRRKAEKERQHAIEAAMLADPGERGTWPLSRALVERINRGTRARVDGKDSGGKDGEGEVLPPPWWNAEVAERSKGKDKGKGKGKGKSKEKDGGDGGRQSSWVFRRSVDSRSKAKDDKRKGSSSKDSLASPSASSVGTGTGAYAKEREAASERLVSQSEEAAALPAYTGAVPPPPHITTTNTDTTSTTDDSPPSTHASTVDLAMAGTERWASRSAVSSTWDAQSQRSALQHGNSFTEGGSDADAGNTVLRDGHGADVSAAMGGLALSPAVTGASATSASTGAASVGATGSAATTGTDAASAPAQRRSSTIKGLWKGKGKDKDKDKSKDKAT